MIKAITAAFLALLAASAGAQTTQPADTGFYLGMDGGKTFFKHSPDDTSLGAFGGYRFNSNVAVEVGYRRLGDRPAGIMITDPNSPVNVIPKIETLSSTSLSLIGSMPVAKDWKVFGRLGVSRLHDSFLGSEYDSNKTLLGVGASYALAPNIDARVEFQRTSGNFRNLSAGISYKF